MDWTDQQAEAGPSRLPYTDGNSQEGGDVSMVDAGNEDPMQELLDEEHETGQEEEQRNGGEEEDQGDQDAEMMADNAPSLSHAAAAAKGASQTTDGSWAENREHAGDLEEPPIPQTDDHGGEGTVDDGTAELRQQQADATLHADSQVRVNGAGHVEQRTASRFARPFYPKKWHAQRVQQQEVQQQRQPLLDGALPAEDAKPSAPARALPDFVPRYQLRGHRKTISCVRISPDGELLATAGADGRILLFALRSGSPPDDAGGTAQRTHSAPAFLRAFAIPPPPPKLVQPGQQAYVNGGPVGSEGVNDIVFSPDGQTIASAGDDKLVRLWRVDGDSAASQDAEADAGESVAIHPQNGQLESRYRQGDAGNGTGSGSVVLKGHTSFVFTLAYSPMGNILASGSYDETIRLWDVKRRKVLRVLPAHSDPVSSVGFSKDGTLLMSCGHDGLLRLWDVSTGQCLKTLVDESSNSPCSYASFSPNSRFVLCSTLDSHIRLWDFFAGKCVATYAGHANVKYHIPSLVYVPPARGGVAEGERERAQARAKKEAQEPLVLVGSEDGRIIFWDLQSREIALELEAHSDPVLCLALHAESGLLVSASLHNDHTVKIWYDWRMYA